MNISKTNNNNNFVDGVPYNKACRNCYQIKKKCARENIASFCTSCLTRGIDCVNLERGNMLSSKKKVKLNSPDGSLINGPKKRGRKRKVGINNPSFGENDLNFPKDQTQKIQNSFQKINPPEVPKDFYIDFSVLSYNQITKFLDLIEDVVQTPLLEDEEIPTENDIQKFINS